MSHTSLETTTGAPTLIDRSVDTIINHLRFDEGFTDETIAVGLVRASSDIEQVIHDLKSNGRLGGIRISRPSIDITSDLVISLMRQHELGSILNVSELVTDIGGEFDLAYPGIKIGAKSYNTKEQLAYNRGVYRDFVIDFLNKLNKKITERITPKQTI